VLGPHDTGNRWFPVDAERSVLANDNRRSKAVQRHDLGRQSSPAPGSSPPSDTERTLGQDEPGRPGSPSASQRGEPGALTMEVLCNVLLVARW
jgi:hypothetical protein